MQRVPFLSRIDVSRNSKSQILDRKPKVVESWREKAERQVLCMD